MYLGDDQHLYQPPVSVVGISHKTLGVTEREEFTRVGADVATLLTALVRECSVPEAAVISTCNRFEIVSAGDSDAPARIVSFLQKAVGRTLAPESFYSYQNADAVRHLFRVASSLDSMVIGESQILGQVKTAYDQSVASGTTGKILHRIFQSAFQIAKRIRANTGIAESGVSVSYIAVKLAEQIFGGLAGRKVVLLGSGRMAELCAIHLLAHGCSEITVVNRTLSRAHELASRVHGTAAGLSDLPALVGKADVVIGSLSADRPIIDSEFLKLHRPKSSLFLIDLGVPRNFSPLASDCDGVFLYNIDDLAGIAEKNRGLREAAAREAGLLIEFGLLQFERWLVRVSAQPSILDIRAQIERACRKVIEEDLAQFIPPENREECITRITHKLFQQIGHDVTKLLSICPDGKLDYESLIPLLFDNPI